MDEARPTQFTRNSLYRSTRHPTRELQDPALYEDGLEVGGVEVEDIPEKYFVTVSGFPPDQSQDTFTDSNRDFVVNKPRNITEV